MGNNILKTKRVRKIIESLSHIHQRFTNLNVFFFKKNLKNKTLVSSCMLIEIQRALPTA